MTFLCDFCGATDFRWFFRLSDGSGVQVACDICLRLIQADDPTRLVQRTTNAMLARGMVTDHLPDAARLSVQRSYQRLLPLLGPPRPISTEGLARLEQVGQQHKPDDAAWAALISEALETS
jgi:hypothetical protein